MTKKPKYTTELSKGQGMIPETLALLNVWKPGMKVTELKDIAVQQGVISRATSIRAKDIVGRVFASRYLRDNAKPAYHLKLLLELGVTQHLLTSLLLIHTARTHAVLHDFITQAYWPKYEAGATQLTRQDALDFLEKATSEGLIDPPWSETMMVRVARYLTGCLTNFQMAGEDRAGKREILDFRPSALATLYLAHDIHFSGFSDTALIEHEDWGLFGLAPIDVRYELDRVARTHFIPQFSGELMRISWRYDNMEEALRGIVAAEI